MTQRTTLAKFLPSILLSASVMVVMLFGACATTRVGGAASTEAMLAAAEFKAVPATTTAQKNYLSSIPPYKITTVTKGSRVAYVYGDPLKNMLYVGGQKEYAAYETMAIQQGISRQDMQTTEAAAMAEIGGNDLTPWEYLELGGESVDQVP